MFKPQKEYKLILLRINNHICIVCFFIFAFFMPRVRENRIEDHTRTSYTVQDNRFRGERINTSVSIDHIFTIENRRFRVHRLLREYSSIFMRQEFVQ